MLKLYQGQVAVWSVKVRLVLAEKGLDRGWGERAFARWRPAQARLSGTQSERFRTLLIHDDFALIESSVMMTQYLDEVFATPLLQPSDLIDRVRMRTWMKRLDEYLHSGDATAAHAMVHAAEMCKKGSTQLEAYDRGIPNPAIHARQRATIERGLDPPSAVQALQVDGKARAEMQTRPERHSWLAGDNDPPAEAAMTPCVVRFAMLALSNMRVRSWYQVSAWSERIRKRLIFTNAILASAGNADLDSNSDLRGRAWTKAHALFKIL